MRIIAVFLLLIVFMTSSSYAVDEDYIKSLKYKFFTMNKFKLPKKLDSITTMEEIRIVEIRGSYIVVTMVNVETDIEKIDNNSLNNIKKSSAQIGCKDPATMDYMKHGLKIGAIYKNKLGNHIGEIQYSINDCN